MKQITIYTLDICPICEMVKEQLKKLGIVYIEQDMSSSESMAELAVNGVYTRNAPVVEIEYDAVRKYFYDDRLLEKDEIGRTLLNYDLYKTIKKYVCNGV